MINYNIDLLIRVGIAALLGFPCSYAFSFVFVLRRARHEYLSGKKSGKKSGQRQWPSHTYIGQMQPNYIVLHVMIHVTFLNVQVT